MFQIANASLRTLGHGAWGPLNLFQHSRVLHTACLHDWQWRVPCDPLYHLSLMWLSTPLANSPAKSQYQALGAFVCDGMVMRHELSHESRVIVLHACGTRTRHVMTSTPSAQSCSRMCRRTWGLTTTRGTSARSTPYTQFRASKPYLTCTATTPLEKGCARTVARLRAPRMFCDSCMPVKPQRLFGDGHVRD